MLFCYIHTLPVLQYHFGDTDYLEFEEFTLVPFEPHLINYDLLDVDQVRQIQVRIISQSTYCTLYSTLFLTLFCTEALAECVPCSCIEGGWGGHTAG